MPVEGRVLLARFVFFLECHILGTIHTNGEINSVEWLTEVDVDHAGDLLSRNIRQHIVLQLNEHCASSEDFFLSAFFDSHIRIFFLVLYNPNKIK